MRTRFHSLFIFIFLISQLSFADGVRFGIEWTFTNKEIIAEAKKEGNYAVALFSNTNARDKLLKKILKKCSTCTLATESNRYFDNEPKYNIQFNLETAVSIDIDPWVIEINGHAVAKDFQKNAEFYKLIFQSADEIGLHPHERIGGGHIHIDFKTAFQGDEQKARNFIVDLLNHPELAMGLLSKDFLNAAPLAMLPQNQQELFQEILTKYDAGRISFDQFIVEINEKVYQVSYDEFDPEPSKKYQAVNLTRAGSHSKARTIELRFFRPPKSFEEFLLQIDLIERRIEFVNQISGRIAYIPKNFRNNFPTANQLAKRFSEFLLEMGQDSEKFKPLLPKKISAKMGILLCHDLFKETP
ncbi:MAG: hypothetical protein AAGB31_00130 [Bdellovibrio sp.]